MNALKKAVRHYVQMRRSLGFNLREAPALLADFIDFMKAQEADYITIALAVQWAQRQREASPAAWAQRLTCIRGFARYWSATDPRTQIPPWGLLPHRFKRAQPHLYSDKEVHDLLQTAQRIGGLRGLTYYCLIGLLSVSGLRISEALNLRPQDVDLERGILVVAKTKFGKSRLVPIHGTTQRVLADYARERDGTFQRGLPYFFVSQRGHRLDAAEVRRTFCTLSRETGLRAPDARRGPRLHDFRHRFAIRALVGWYRSGQDAKRQLPVLSTYLGHAHVSDTYWYFTACPELMGLAAKRLEKRWKGKP